MVQEASLGEVSRDANGSIDPDYSIRLLNFIATCAKAAIKDKEASMIAERRKLHAQQDWEAFSKIHQDHFKLTELNFETCSAHVCDLL